MSRQHTWSLTLGSSAAQAFGAGLVIAYNLLVRAAISASPPMSDVVSRASKIYALTAVILGYLAGRKKAARLSSPAESAAFPLKRALLSSMLWLGAIPVLTVVAVVANGRVHPVGYPHFVASTVVAWLVSTAYSSVFNVLVAVRSPTRSTFTREHLVPLTRVIRSIPWLAGGVPFAAAVVFVFMMQPWNFPTSAAYELRKLLVGLMTLGGYGFLFCRWLMPRLEASINEIEQASCPASKASVGHLSRDPRRPSAWG